jgi:peptide/nickel transport system substrate-binding protein
MRRSTRRQFLRTGAYLGVGAAMAGRFTPHVLAASSAPKRGGTVVVGVYQEANSLNWILTGGNISFATMTLSPMFDPMLRVNQQSQLEPALLAEVPSVANGGISKDGMTYTLRMRPGVKWDDGAPCTMRDWAFTWKWIMTPKNGAIITSGWDKIANVQVKNDTTAVVILKQQYIPFVAETLADWQLLPEHAQGKMTSQDFGRKPVGNGPFKFAEWASGDHITMVRNPLYWRPQKAYLDRIVFKVLPDRNTVIAQAKTGDIDLGIDYTEAQIPEMSKAPNVNLIITHPPIYERYHFTMVSRDDVTKPHAILGDIRVRRALVMATDRQTVINTVLFGRTKIAKNELDNTAYEDASIHPLPFSLDQARALLDEAGWKLGSDGIRTKDGQRLSLTFSTTAGNQTRATIEAIVQANWKAVGVEMTIHDEPASNFFGSFSEGGGWLARKYDVVGFANGLSSVDPNLRPFWHSSEIPTKEKPNGLNASGLADPKLDALLDAQLKEFDPAKRRQLLDQAQVLLHNDVPMIPMYDRATINSVNKRVHGVNPTDFGGITGLMWNTYEWWVE